MKSSRLWVSLDLSCLLCLEILQGQSAVSQYWVLAEVQNLPSLGLSFLICKMACFL